jgi:hypothetical protein
MTAEVAGRDGDWYDGDAGPLVRPYTLTGGRVRAAAGLDLVAYIVTTDAGSTTGRYLTPEHRRILDVAGTPTSVAEMASHLNLALGVVRVMLGDLLAEGLIVMHEPSPRSGRPAAETLEAVLDVLRSL